MASWLGAEWAGSSEERPPEGLDGAIVFAPSGALMVAALRHVTATRVGIVAMLEPVVATIVAWLWLRESLSPVQLVGAAVVLTGIVLAQTAR